ncbi:type IX secretion system membrane protein PorP/SprF [Robertkochia marina]|uniref:Type IX secretion system membrane protein PorP/SprF n=2 Tax=Robertkochia marina TaxID=1227945 RepID=A0A4S3M4G4_9FLAO|nr:PorP/SprF family type IX secretion system membrane protein [Robertkochia marina]THD70013.1 type IX secretion system membrane protein PorP/SprF [Robertkochia marina]TRZ47417.1 type IX secretion system membrane protein PorP/SprF [Robertkochia marina]
MIRKWSYILMMLIGAWVYAQEEAPVATIQIPGQNLLKFNRFVINPTFSTVQEDKSYLNLYHRNQWVRFDDNYQTYLGSYSGRIGDRMGVGLSVYHQRFATISNFGVMANYAYGVKLAEKSNLTFGFNLSYYDSGIDQSNVNIAQPDDPLLLAVDGNSLISFQPGVNLSLGSFDVGVYAENLFDYNLKTNQSLTEFDQKTWTGHLMYTRKFNAYDGLFENGKLSMLSRARSIAGDDLNLSGSLILDLPKLGWIQTGYDDVFGLAAGLGFNLTDRISIGYTFEKGIEDQIANLGVTHEVNFAYSFTPTLTENRVFEDLEEENQMVYSEESEEEVVSDKDAEIARLKDLVEENNMIIEEMMFRQDSMEQARKKDINRRFAYMQKFVKDYADRDNREEINQQLQQFKKDMDEGVAFTEPSIDTNRYKKREPVLEQPVSYSRKADLAATEPSGSTQSKEEDPAKDLYAANDPNMGIAQEEPEAEKPVAKKPITATSTDRVSGASRGYYLIANVFRSKSNLERFLKKLKAQGIEASSFQKNGLNYVYLERFDDIASAKQAYKTDLNGLYDGKSWVLQVREDSNAVQNDTRLAQNTSKRAKTIKQATTGNTPEGDSKYNDYINKQRAILSECTDRYVNNLISTFRKREDREVLYAENRETAPQPKLEKKGYYIVANVFKNDEYAQKFVDALKKQGIEANIYINPRNKYKYVYLQKHDSWRKAMSSYRSNVNYTYDKDIWIMPVGSS